MASVYAKRGTWYVAYVDGTGRRRTVATKASTKAAAKRLAGELERKAERQRLGLDPLPAEDRGGTVGELMTWWLKTYVARQASHERTAGAVRCYVEGSPLASMCLADVTSGDVEAHLQSLPAHLSAKTINNVRGYLSAAFGAANKAGRWTAGNPVAGVAKRKVPRRAYDYLRANEVPAVLGALAVRWRPMFATAIYAGLRKGELFALRKRDVDLRAGLLTVARSHERDTTKGGHADVIPIHPELAPFLRQALDASPGPLVFPAAGGGQLSEETDLVAVLRRALARAGVVTGWVHKCRRKGCGYSVEAAHGGLRRCPEDGRKLWPVPVPRPLRFHDLRHTCATLLLQAGASLAVVQRVMRHTDPKITTETYGHLAADHVATEIAKLRLGIVATPEPPAERARAVGNATVALPGAPEPVDNAKRRDRESRHSEALRGRVRPDSNRRPTGSKPCSEGVQSVPTLCNPLETLDPSDATGRHGSQLSTGVFKNSATQALPAFRLLPGGADDLLTVRDVATRLGLSTATVYALIDRGDLAHVRVSTNAIRVHPADLAAYLETRRR